MYEGAAAPAGRARAAGRVLHLTYHTCPYYGEEVAVRMVAAAALTACWLVYVPLGLQLRCLTAATLYSFTEYSFTLLERGAAYTSAAQFWANVLYTPLLLELYGQQLAAQPALYVACFPLNIWLLEVIVAGVITWLFGHNVAWCYDDYADAMCGGAFRIGHGAFWLVLGAGCLACYPALVDATDGAAAWLEAELSAQWRGGEWRRA